MKTNDDFGKNLNLLVCKLFLAKEYGYNESVKNI